MGTVLHAYPHRVLAALAILGAGCIRVALPTAPAPELFALDEPPPAPAAAPAAGGAAIAIPAVQAAPGLEGRELRYVDRPHQVRSYARSAWVEPPARMLAPLLATALTQAGLRVAEAGEAGPRLRLEVELTALRQEFLARPSQVRAGLRFRLLAPDGRLLAGRALEALEPAPTDDAYGGVVAANRAVARLLGELAAACAGAGQGGHAGRSAEP